MKIHVHLDEVYRGFMLSRGKDGLYTATRDGQTTQTRRPLDAMKKAIDKLATRDAPDGMKAEAVGAGKWRVTFPGGDKVIIRAATEREAIEEAKDRYSKGTLHPTRGEMPRDATYNRKKHGPLTITPYQSGGKTIFKAVSRSTGKLAYGNTSEEAANALASQLYTKDTDDDLSITTGMRVRIGKPGPHTGEVGKVLNARQETAEVDVGGETLWYSKNQLVKA